MQGIIEGIFIAPREGVKMCRVDEIEAVAGCGLRGDRYCERTGHYSGSDECQVTLIAAEDLEEISRTTGVHVKNGEHRRNLITRGIKLDDLLGRQFQVGDAVLKYDKPRPPCSYVQSITEPGMTQALMGRAGICARVIQSGLIRQKDPITVIEIDLGYPRKIS